MSNNRYIVGIVGNPNCGKTTVFNALTGSKQRVGNWPGVTVERKTGECFVQDTRIEVVDLPGIYSLSALSIDEEVASSYVLSGEANLIINVLDASNLERNLYLTMQLLEMRAPLLIALNMMDVAKDRRIEINAPALSERLGCPIIPIVASREDGMDALRASLATMMKQPPMPSARVSHTAEIEQAVQELLPVVRKESREHAHAEWLALKALEGEDKTIAKYIGRQTMIEAERLRSRIEKASGEEMDILIADSRYGMIRAITTPVVNRRQQVSRTSSDAIDRIVLNRVLGIPIFLAVMYAMFMFTINIGGAFIDFFDMLTGAIFVDGVAHVLGALGSPAWLIALLANGFGASIQTIATFIPPIACMFFFLSLLEDSGYMARAAFVVDRFMRVIGLPGKSFVPMLVGFGCTVPAIMATRTLENQRDRTLTIMMNPFMSCGARLPVYALFAAAFFPRHGQNLVFGLYLTGIGAAILTGLILKHTLLKGEASPFVMELPAYHRPTLTGVGMRAWDRLKSFMLRAGKVILLIVMILGLFNSVGTDGSFGNEDSERSILSAIGKSLTPIVAPMGITQDNWPATVGIFTGIFAKEAVVGTLDALYAQNGADEAKNAEEPESFSLWNGIREAFATIPANLAGVAESMLDPLGLSLGEVINRELAAEEHGVSVAAFNAMVARFDGKIGALAYLLFILLYFPCGAAIAAVYRETNWRWTTFVGLWTTGMAYVVSTTFYQIATFSRHPAFSAAWLGAMGVFCAGIILTMWRVGRNTETAAREMSAWKIANACE